MARWRHYFGICYKSRLGYTCHGGNNYAECFGWDRLKRRKGFTIYY